MITDRPRYHSDDHADGCEYMMKCVREYEYTTYGADWYMIDLICIYSIQIHFTQDLVTTS